MEKKTRFIELTNAIDERGILTHGEVKRELPFAVKRVFWITKIPTDCSRGGHAHKTNIQLVFCVNGSFVLDVYDGCEQKSYMLDDAGRGVLVYAGEWCNLHDFSNDCTIVVLASEEYNAAGYLNTREEYEEWLKSKSL